jgi:hypothetical protein
MLFEEAELALLFALAFEQLSHGPQAVGPVRKRHAAGLFQCLALMDARQVFQAY